jgi:predicted TPR repeat methyltransferase
LVPDRAYTSALDLGCGIGLLTERLAHRADQVLGLDVSQVAVDAANKRNAHVPNLTFAQADVLNLSDDLDNRFDLVVVADVLYYLQPMTDPVLKAMAMRIRRLLRPGGICVVANHFFFDVDPDSRLSRRIHQAFAWSPGFNVLSEHRRAFYLVSVLEAA